MAAKRSLQPTRKVTAAAGGGIGGGVVATFANYLIGAYVYHGGIDGTAALAAVPSPVEALVFSVVPGAAAYVAGWLVAEAPKARQ